LLDVHLFSFPLPYVFTGSQVHPFSFLLPVDLQPLLSPSYSQLHTQKKKKKKQKNKKNKKTKKKKQKKKKNTKIQQIYKIKVTRNQNLQNS